MFQCDKERDIRRVVKQTWLIYTLYREAFAFTESGDGGVFDSEEIISTWPDKSGSGHVRRDGDYLASLFFGGKQEGRAIGRRCCFLSLP